MLCPTERHITIICLKMTTTELTAEEIHQIGLAEVARIRTEMEAIKAERGFDGSLQEFFVFMRMDDQFFFPDNETGAQMYIYRATKSMLSL